VTAPDRLNRIRTATSFLLLALALPASAAAHGDKPVIPDAVKALQKGPIYVDYDAKPSVTELEADSLGRQLAARKHVFVAVLPASARSELGTGDEGVAIELVKSVGRDGTYLVVVGGKILVAKGGKGPLSIGVDVATDNTRAADPLATRLSALASQVPPERTETNGGQGSTIVLALVGAAVVAFWWARVKRRRAARPRPSSRP
jgi:hypothetical protein